MHAPFPSFRSNDLEEYLHERDGLQIRLTMDNRFPFVYPLGTLYPP
jgi:hypothetical protein